MAEKPKETVIPASPPKPKSEIRKYAVPGLLAVYLHISLIVWGWVLLDISTETFNTLKWLRITVPKNLEFYAILKLVFYAAIGGAIGGIVYGMQNLWKHATKGNFKIVYAGDYVFRQFGAATLAVMVFALIRGGILTALGTDPTTGATTVASSFSALAIGFLSGFGSYQVINKLDELIKQAFGTSSSNTDQDQPNEGSTPKAKDSRKDKTPPTKPGAH
jgi:hypothetical protein